MKILNILTLFFLFCLTGCAQDLTDSIDPGCLELFPNKDTVINTHSQWTRKHYPEMIEHFKSEPVLSGDIVMLGNSLTEQGGNWSERLKLPNVKNRGISGDNTDGVLARLNEIVCGKPSKVFLMIGTNDLWTDHSPAEIFEKIDRIANTLSRSDQDIMVYVQTILPLAKDHEKAKKLAEINALIRGGNSSAYRVIDTSSEFTDDSGAMRPDLTTDGVHLTEKGYQVWSSFLQTFLL